MGATLVAGGATFRVWAPRARAVYLSENFWQRALLLIRLRWRQPALRSESARSFHAHNDNRIIAFHRWIEQLGRDVVVVASFSDDTFRACGLGFPSSGRWLEVFNSDVYDNWVNPQVVGNGGAVFAEEGAMHGFDFSCQVVIAANGVVVFARDGGD